MFALRHKQIVFIAACSFAILSACSSACPDGITHSGVGAANISPSVKWGGDSIPVCWERLSDSAEADRSLVERVVAEEISSHAAIRFVGWAECNADSGMSLRIAVADTAPETAGIGRKLAGVAGGIRLNTRFAAWGAACGESDTARTACLRATSVHEFLHALGFSHEQNRPDTPAACHEPSQGDDAEKAFGAWDAHSAMNYCNDIWNNGGHLSGEDIEALQYLYGAPGGMRPANSAGQRSGSAQNAQAAAAATEVDNSCRM